MDKIGILYLDKLMDKHLDIFSGYKRIVQDMLGITCLDINMDMLMDI